MKKILAILITAMLLLTSTGMFAWAESGTAPDSVLIYVAPDGDDAATGTEDAPLATLDAALEAARIVRSEGNAPIEILMRGGEYYVDHTVVIDESLSGTEDAPFVIRACEGEEVRVIGGVKVDRSRMSKVTDDAILNRVIDREAAANLYALDLEGIIGELDHKHGGSETLGMGDVRVYMGEERMQYARWPNEEPNNAYLYTNEITMAEDGTYHFSYVDETDRAATYWSEEAMENLWIIGYLAYEWANDPNQVLEFDYAARQLKTSGHMDYDPQPGAHRFFFYNVLEEIDVPGESYLDREGKKLYFYPVDAEEEDIYVTLTNSALLKVNGASNVVIEGVDFMYSRTTALTASNVSHLQLLNCDIAHTSYDCANLAGDHIVVDGCNFYDAVFGGIRITGGDRKNLISSENVIRNCEFHDLNCGGRTHGFSIHVIQGIGMTIQNNLFYNFNYSAMRLDGNDLIVEYNELHRGVTDAGDMGAIYFGRDPSLLGIVIRYNYFHDIGNTYDMENNGQQAIFMDDGSIGAHIYGNVFYKASVSASAIKNNGSQYAVIENNIFADTPSAMLQREWSNENSQQATRWWLFLYDKSDLNELGVWNRISSVDFESQLWRDHYAGTQWDVLWDNASTEMYELLNSPEYANAEARNALAREHAPSKTNILRNNLAYAVKQGAKFGGAICKTENGGSVQYDKNIRLEEESDFVEYGVNFALTDEALKAVKKSIPKFENIPMDKIGPFNND